MTPTAQPVDEALVARVAHFWSEWTDDLAPLKERGVYTMAAREFLEQFPLASTPPTKPAPRRGFVPAHLGIVYLLAEQQGATHVRLRRLWDAKSARSGPHAWPWISDSGLRTRCSELVRWGIVEDSGAHGESPTGRRATIWTLVGALPSALGRDVEPVPTVDPTVAERLDVLLAQAGDDVVVRSQLALAAQIAYASPAAARDTSAVAK